MQWHAYFHEVDLGLVEIVNINDALSMLSASDSIAVNPNKGTSISSIVSILTLIPTPLPRWLGELADRVQSRHR